MLQDSDKIQLVEDLAVRGEWDQVATESSSYILGGISPYSCVYLYRYWVEALVQNKDFIGLHFLAKHLLKFRDEFPQFVPLALMCLSQSGKRELATRVVKCMRIKSNIDHESYAIFLTESQNKSDRIKGVEILYKLSVSQLKYFPIQICALNAALENECYVVASSIYKIINENFPSCAEPYWAAARIAIGDGRWHDAARLVEDILQDNPINQDAILVAAKCFEACGDLKIATNLLLSNQYLFNEYDMEFNLALGHATYKLWKRNKRDEDKVQSLKYLKNAAVCLNKLGQSMAEVDLCLNDLELSGRKIAETQSKPDIWVLNLNTCTLQSLLEGSTELFRAPENLKFGDYVILRRDDFVIGVMNATSHRLADSEYGTAIRLGNIKIFDIDTNIKNLKLGQNTNETGFVALDFGQAVKIVELIERDSEVKIFGDSHAS